jgi:pentose-5-phosphate-3-epimerase
MGMLDSGPPLSNPCGTPIDTPSEDHQKNSSDRVDVVLFLFVGVGFGVGFAIAILVKQVKQVVAYYKDKDSMNLA